MKIHSYSTRARSGARGPRIPSGGLEHAPFRTTDDFTGPSAKATYFQATGCEARFYTCLSSFRVLARAETMRLVSHPMGALRFNLRSAWLLQGPGDSSKSNFYLDFFISSHSVGKEPRRLSK
ncbi:hypothetical protein FRC08_014501 [Ceratobasidium sp. 394]|nr:hypothetical protein FRC08_014501 [Ceratobasidium sp. 394]